jgi:hypothetical protein
LISPLFCFHCQVEKKLVVIPFCPFNFVVGRQKLVCTLAWWPFPPNPILVDIAWLKIELFKILITNFWTQQLELQTEDFPQCQSLFAMVQNAPIGPIRNFYTDHLADCTGGIVVHFGVNFIRIGVLLAKFSDKKGETLYYHPSKDPCKDQVLKIAHKPNRFLWFCSRTVDRYAYLVSLERPRKGCSIGTKNLQIELCPVLFTCKHFKHC